MNRRRFLGMNAAGSAAFFSAEDLKSAVLDANKAVQNRRAALRVRIKAATASVKRANSEQITTRDQERYADKRASFSKTLPHNELGEVLPDAYRSFVDILNSGEPRQIFKDCLGRRKLK